MYSNAPGAKVIDPQNAADNISTQVVKNQDFPDWISIWV